MKITVIGHKGFLGKKLYRILNFHNLQGIDKEECDIVNFNGLQAKFIEKPDLIIHTVAIAEPLICKEYPIRALEINILGTYNVVKLCKENNIPLIFISTDYACGDLSLYAQTKRAGEEIVKTLDIYKIYRLPLLFGYNNRYDKETFVLQIINKKLEINNIDNVKIRTPILLEKVCEEIKYDIEHENINNEIKLIQGEIKVTKREFAEKIKRIFFTKPKKDFVFSYLDTLEKELLIMKKQMEADSFQFE